MNKKHFILLIILTLLTSGVLLFGKDRFNNTTDDIIIPTEFIFQGKTIALAWTDDNTGEDLIIQSDRKEYSGFNEIDVYFSITNASGEDQNMDVVVWVGNKKVEVKEIERLSEDGVGSIVPLGLWNLDAEQSQKHTPSPSQEGNQNYETSDEANSQAGSTASSRYRSTSDNGANDARKDIKGFTNGYAVNDQIKSGETNFYKTKIKYPPMSNGEFFIEAFGVGSIVSAELWNPTAEQSQAGSTALRDYGANDIAYGHLDPWYSSSWNYKRQITIDHSEVSDVADPSATYAGFPVYVHATGLSNIKTDGADIRFTDSAGTELPREIEKYASGTLDAWVKVTLTKDAGDTSDDVIYMYYGNDSAVEPAPDSAYGRENVWDDNFVMVQHLQETPDNTVGQIKDSTSNANDGQTFTMASDDQVAGQIDGSLDFDGGSDYVDYGNATSLNIAGNITMSAILKVPPSADYERIISKSYYISAGNRGGYFLQLTNTGVLQVGANNDATYYSYGTTILDDNTSHFVTGVFVTGVGIKLFVDGQEESITTVGSAPGSIKIISENLSLGRIFFGGSYYYGESNIDEVRISNTARHAGWIETEYNNQSDVGSFMTIGVEISNNWYSTNWKYRRQIDINSSQIAITTSDFPVLVTITLDDLKTIANSGKVENENGYDIIFVDFSGNTLLNYEREKYSSTTGEIVYWIKMDISSTLDKAIFMYYGNADATDQSNATGVWDDNYKGVWHLAETDIDNDVGDIKDSTTNANNGTTYNMNTDDQVTGQINGSLDFDGDNDHISIGNAYNGVKTISFWLKSDDITDRMILDTDGTDYIQINASSEIEPISFPAATIYIDGAVASLIDTNWHYAVITDTTGVNASVMDIGKVVSSYFDGQIDEVRISNIARSTGWIETEYNNQSDPSSFLTINAEESLKLVITTSAKILTAGTESTAFTVQTQDLSNNPMNMGSDMTINLSSDSLLYSFASTTGGTAISSVTIPSGSNSVDFYYTDHKTGTPTITVIATNLVDTQQQTVQARDPWYNASYQYRRRITLESDQIATTTDAFPILVNDTLADMKTTTNGGKVGNDNGYDILFTDDDGTTLLNYEREKYASTTGEIVYWIKTDISSTTDKTIYMYYGNADATDQSNAAGVWDDNFVMVQHLQETPDNTEDQIKDSTSNANDGQTFTMASDDQVVGQIDGSLDFDGGSDYVNAGNDDSLNLGDLTDSYSVGAWFKTSDGDGVIVSKNQFSQTGLMPIYLNISSGQVRFAIRDTDTIFRAIESGGTNYDDDNWHYVVGIRDVDNDIIKIVVDGNDINSEADLTDSSMKNINSIVIGTVATLGEVFTSFFNGQIDEVRISNTARSAGWIETEYNNQSDTDSFMTIFGAEEGILTISTDPKVIIAGTESAAFTVQTDHNVATDTTVNLSSDSTGTYHFAATPGGAEVSSVTISSGTDSVDFYYTDNEAGSPTIVVSATNFVSDDQQQTVVKIVTQLNSPHTDKWTDGLVGYWSFDGQDMDWASSSAEARDTSGQANHGDVIGAASVIGKVGQGMSFDGSDDYVDVGNVYNGVKTVAFWVKADNLSKKIIDIGDVSWYGSDWNYRKSVTIESDYVETTESSFPALVSVTDLDLRSTGNGGHVLQANGYDIIFTDDDGTTLLDFEIESWNSSTGEIQTWVESDISATVDKTIYMYYGNASATDLSNAEGVWDSNFVGVWHMSQDPTGSAPQMIDSTSNDNDGTSGGSFTSDDQVTGQIDGGLDYDDYGDEIKTTGYNVTLHSTHTYSIWASVNIYSQNGTVFVSGEDSLGNVTMIEIGYDDVPYGGCVSYVTFEPISAVDDGVLRKYDFVFDGNNNKARLYINGSQSGAEKAYSTLVSDNDKLMQLGGYIGGSTWDLNGILDEVRISNTARTAGWIETEYNNQNAPETFLDFGDEQTDCNIEIVSGTIIANNFTSSIIYVDGAVSSIIDTDWHHVIIVTDTGINANALKIGRIAGGYFNGIIDEVRIYDRALSADEIAKQYRVGARKFQIDPSKGYKTIIE